MDLERAFHGAFHRCALVSLRRRWKPGKVGMALASMLSLKALGNKQWRSRSNSRVVGPEDVRPRGQALVDRRMTSGAARM
jgi:hypothetical protein